jgi:hypothetical protein
MAVIHISEAEAARDFAGLLARVRAGAEVVIDDDASAAVMLRVAAERPVRRLSESLRLAKEHGWRIGQGFPSWNQYFAQCTPVELADWSKGARLSRLFWIIWHKKGEE